MTGLLAAAMLLGAVALDVPSAGGSTVDEGPGAPSLGGTVLQSPNGAFFPKGFGPGDPSGCDPDGQSVVQISGNGPVTGPHPGLLTISGSFTLGPQAPSDRASYGFPGEEGALRSISAQFTIARPSLPPITGTITGLAPSNPDWTTARNVGACYGVGAGPNLGFTHIDHGEFIAIDAYLTYSAVVDGVEETGNVYFRDQEACYRNVNDLGFDNCFYSGNVLYFAETPTVADTTPPVLAPTVSPNPVRPGDPVTADAGASDPETGIASSSCDPAPTDVIGTFTIQCTATNGAGLISTTDVTYVVEAEEPVEPEDSDGDGLWDVIEIWLGCDPHDPDSDDDGINDWIEVVIGTDPLDWDTHEDPEFGNDGSYLEHLYGHICGCGPEDDEDGDGVPSWVEIRWGTNHRDPDTDGPGHGFTGDDELIWHLCGCKPVDEDGDGVPTMVEHRWGGGVLEIIHRCGCRPWEDPDGGGGIWIDFIYVGGPGGPPDDPDGDGLHTVIERWLGCNPDDPDTDGDGLDDGREIELGTNPLDPDTDGDGMRDGREIELGCDPLDPDTDGDGDIDGIDPQPLIPRLAIITIDDVTVEEGSTAPVPATFTISLDRPLNRPVSVQTSVAPGTATTPADYLPPGPGTVTFAPGETSHTLTVVVMADRVDEPDEQYTVELANPVNAVLARERGIGTIVDDDRSGTFTCQATSIVLLLNNLGSTGPGTPCRDATKSLLLLPIPLGVPGASVKVDTINVTTDSRPDDVTASAPAVGDAGAATATVQGLSLNLAGISISADKVTATATAECAAPLGSPTLSGASAAANLRINGKLNTQGPKAVDIEIPLIGTLHLNWQGRTADGVVQRAIWLEGKGLFASVQVVVAEARAGTTGNPCSTAAIA